MICNECEVKITKQNKGFKSPHSDNIILCKSCYDRQVSEQIKNDLDEFHMWNGHNINDMT